MELLDHAIGRFCKDFTRTVRCRFSLGKNRTSESLEFKESTDGYVLERGPGSDGAHVGHALEDLNKIIYWLSRILPLKITSPLASMLLPSLISRFIKDWLETAIPLSLAEMKDFENLLEAISDTAESIGRLGWAGREELVEWVDTAPRTWLTKRRERTLDDARRMMLNGLNEKKVVQRVETEMVTKDDIIRGGTERTDDDWDAAWDEGEDKSFQPPPPENVEDEDDQDASAWDTEDEAKENNVIAPPQAASKETTENDEEDTWGWGDDEQDSSEVSKSPVEAKKQNPKINGSGHTLARSSGAAEREVTLKETLTVTSVPDGILEIVTQIVSDAEGLTKPE